MMFDMDSSEGASAFGLPGIVLASYAAKLSRRELVRDPSNPASPWKAGTAALTRFIVLHVLRVLYYVWSPVAGTLSITFWCFTALAALAAYSRRLATAFIGWQNEPIIRHEGSFARSFLPDLRRWHITVAFVLLGGLAVRAGQCFSALFNEALRRKRCIQKDMDGARSFEEWKSLASEFDTIQSKETHQPRATELYDVKLLEAKTAELEGLRMEGRVEELMFVLRSDLHRDFGNMTNRNIHLHSHILPRPIRAYIETVGLCLDFIAHSQSGPTLSSRLEFFKETRHAFGRSALVLSGGGALGAFHLGIVRGLMEQGLLPRIIAGSSVGSIVAALAAVHTDAELQTMYSNMDTFNLSFFANDSTLQAIFHLFKKGSLQDVEFLKRRLRAMLSDVTFLDAYQRTNRFLNVTVTAADTNEPPRLLNYLTAPNVVIWSAVAASSAFPGLFPPQDILARNPAGNFVSFGAGAGAGAKRRWYDGSLVNDLPFRQLSEMFNANHFIVSQTNPHLVPLMTLRSVLPSAVFNIVQAEVKHFFLQAQAYTPPWLPNKWMSLFTQPWEGDVTIVMPWSLYKRTISRAMYNPSPQDLVEADDLGRRAAWQRMSAIEGNCAIELKLDECLTAATAQADAASGTGKRNSDSRIPSWLHLPTARAAATVLLAASPLVDASRARSRQPTADAAAVIAPADAAVDIADDGEQQPHSSARHRRCCSPNGLDVDSVSSSSGEGIAGIVPDDDEAGTPRKTDSPRKSRPAEAGLSTPDGEQLPSEAAPRGAAQPPSETGVQDAAHSPSKTGPRDGAGRSSDTGVREGQRPPYGAVRHGAGWPGLRPLAQSVECVGLRFRQQSSFALDVMAP